jgi:predicted flap endonuclease-1-like 5' DNA nuclease
LKSVFGFLTGAVIGAGGLLGLRKALSAFDKTGSPVPARATSSSSSTSDAVESSPSKSEKSSTPSAKKDDVEVTVSAPDSAEKPGETASLVGEPIARHTEPAAASQTDPEATTPRSEITEPAVRDEPEVQPATEAAPVQDKTVSDTLDSSPKKSKKSGTKSTTDDFTVIIDIGPVFNQKLHDAGITSFKALARLTPAEIADKTGISAERIEYGQWVEQAQKLLTGEENK